MSTQSESIGVYMPVSELVPWDQNPRLNESAVEEVAKSIKRFGFASPIIARTADNMVIAGHTRLLAAKKIGLKSVPVRFMDLDLNDAQLLALADNKIGEIADWDETKLKDILASLDDQDLSGLGWSDDELDALIDHHEPVELNGDPDHVPEVQELAITSAGDLWLLGDHRLLCGDSTKEEDVGRLMDGSKADMVFTDPPYGVDYEGGHGEKKREGIKNDNITSNQITDLFYRSLLNAFTFSKDHSAFYIWYASGKSQEVYQSFSDLKLDLRAVICWYKIKSGLGAFMAQYIPNYEPCIYAYKQGFSPQWFGPSNEKTVWELQRENINKLHPTQKPTALAERAISNSSLKNQIILDLFGGSGSTLIACEQTNRKCFMMELDPKYCDVIIRRWQDLTGKEAVKEDGIKFNDITDIPW